MKKLLLAVAGIMVACTVSAQSWNWAVSGGGRSNTEGYTSIATDNAGNAYLCGDFEGTKSFGTTTLTAAGFGADGFIAKYNNSGVFQWAIQISGTGLTNFIEAAGITVDLAGNVYACMNFSSTIIIGGNTYTNNAGNFDGMLLKCTSAGNIVWGLQIGGNGNERITQLSHYNGGLYLCGSHNSSFSVGSVTIAGPSSGNLDDAFLVKCDTTGNPLWAKNGGSTFDDRALAVNAGPGGIYFGGYFTGSANFGGTTLVSGSVQGQAQPDWFVVKLTESGTQLWAKDFGGSYGEQLTGISQTPFGSVYCIGNFYGTSSFGTGITLTEFSPGGPAGNGDVFVCLIDALNGNCSWARHIRCVNANNNETGNSISCDYGGSAYITGAFNANTTFANTATQTGTTLTATSGKDSYVAKYGITGNLLWVVKIGGSGNDVGKSIVWNPNGYCTTAGNFSSTITIAPGITITSATTSSSYYIANYNGLTASTEELSKDEYNMYPNPTSGMLNISMRDKQLIDRIEVYSITGKLVLTETIGFSSDEMKLNLQSLETGTYLIRLVTANGTGVEKIQVNK